MKKFLLAFALTASLLSTAQHNWQSAVSGGFSHAAKFGASVVFQNKLYITGDTMGGILVYSSANPETGTFTEVTGIQAVTQGGTESTMYKAVANGSYMFLGSSTYFDTTGGFIGTAPAVYRYDGTTFTKHGALNYASLPANNHLVSSNYLSVNAMALYSPTGANDSIYAFVAAGFPNNVSVWKAPANQASPTWVNSTNFSAGSGITTVYDAKVWHKKLYVAVNSSFNGGMILRTADGQNWDTVTTGLSMAPVLGVNSFNDYFTALEVHNDTLIAGVIYSSKNIGLVYTADSLATTQTWSALIDSVGMRGVTPSWINVRDLHSDGTRLWVQCTSQSFFSPLAYMVMKNKMNKDSLFGSSGGSGLENTVNSGDTYSLSNLNNHIFSTGHIAPASKLASPQGTSMYSGNMYSFFTINPTAAFIDSVGPNSGFCAYTSIYLVNKSQNASSYEWFLNSSHYSWAKDTVFSTSTAGTYTFHMVAYNGNYQSTFKDSVTSTVLIHPVPSSACMASASSYTICQGQTDSLFVSALGGTPPYTFTWHNVNENLTYNGGDTTVITLYTVPSFSPYIYMYVDMKDANMCTWGNAPPPVYIYVNPADSLSGLVIDTNLNPVTAGKVYLFKLNPLNPQPGDTIQPSITLGANGAYSYPTLLYGSYIAKAEADTSNPLYKTAVGTYYSNKVYPFQWDSALVIQHHSCAAGNVSGNDIKILQMPPPITGPGLISGQITYDSSYTGARLANGGGILPMGAPLKGVDVKLGKNPGGSPAARTTTDTSGHYTFPNVPLGSYKIYVDIPNYGMDSARAVTINTVTPTSVSNDYYVDSSMIHLIPLFNTTAAICMGDSVMLGGAYQMAGGVYSDTVNVNGHDSIVVTTLSVKPLPTLTVTTSADTICLGGSGAVLSAIGNSTTYQWSGNAGSVTTATVSVNPIITDTYTITGTLNGCPAIKTIKVVVKSCIGIQNYSANGISLYPNPATDKLNVEVLKSGTVKLFDITGQLVLEKAINAGKNEISLGNIAAGAYEVSVNAGGVISNSKLMISK